jgi:hypothetical protein
MYKSKSLGLSSGSESNRNTSNKNDNKINSRFTTGTYLISDDEFKSG